ncbi:MAG: RHS repeat-associated core domain-containing protein, partial [bacterium]|nr:RHS repeat-associated core domain-containing protein [bacterium]
TLYWSSKNAKSCTASGDWTGPKTVNSANDNTGGYDGDERMGPLTSTKTYTITCSNSGGTSAPASVTVNVRPQSDPSLTFAADTTSIISGGSVVLTWDPKNISSCTASNGWTGGKATTLTSQTISNVTADTVYEMTCKGNNGVDVWRSVAIAVTGPTLKLTANSTLIPNGASATLSWMSTNLKANSCTPSGGGWTGTGLAGSGTKTFTGLTANTTYTLTCTGTNNASISSSVSVTVTPAPQPTVDEIMKSEGEPSFGNCMVGNPCNPATGNKYQVEEDFASSNAGLSLTRYYNSIDTKNGKDFGNKWSFTYGSKLDVDWGPAGAPQCITQASSTVARAVTVREPDGGGIPFTCKPAVSDATTYQCTGQADAGRVRLYQEACNFRLIRPTGEREYYTLGGRKQFDADKVGHITNYAYNAKGTLSRISGPFGHYLKFSYRVNDDRISTVESSESMSKISYFYDTNNNLTKVTYPDNTSKIYHYEKVGFPNHLTGISYVDTAGVIKRFSKFDYDSNGKTTLTQHVPLTAASVDAQEKFSFAYDSSIQTTVTDAIGIKSVMKYSTQWGMKNLIEVFSPSDGKSVKQTYYPNNNLKCHKDEEGHVTTYGYSSTGQLSSVTEGQKGDCVTPITVPGVTRTSMYWYLTDYTDEIESTYSPSVEDAYVAPSGSKFAYTKATVFSYDDPRFYLPTGITVRSEVIQYSSVTKNARTTKIGYNDLGQINSIDGPRTDVSDITKFDYYQCNTGFECGQLKSTTNALNHVTTYNTYDANGRLKKMTDPNGLVTEYVYDLRGRVKTVTETTPSGGTVRTTTFTYKAWGDIETATFPDATKLTYDYYDSHDVYKVTDRGGNYINYFYDAKGNVIATENHDLTNALSRYVTYTHDIRNRLDTINAAGSITNVDYDAVGNLVKVIDPNNNPATTFTPDELNRNTLAIEHGLAPTNFKYNAAGNLATTSSPFDYPTGVNQKHENTYKYNDHGDLLTSVSPDTGKTTYTYDEAGNVKTKKDARNVTVTYTYDALNRPTFIDYPGTNEDVTLKYDTSISSDPTCTSGKGRLCRVEDQSGTTNYAYDAFGNVVMDAHSQIGTLSYMYDKVDRVSTITYPSGMTILYKRDPYTGRIKDIERTGNGITTPIVIVKNRLYYSDGLLKSQTYGNNVNEVLTYDRQGRMTKQTVGGVVRDYSLYDANGNLKTLTVTGLSGLTAALAYTYNIFDQLESDTYRFKYTYTYDFNGSGNRTSSVRTTLAGLSPSTSSNTYTPSTNRLSTAYGKSAVLDAAGNTKSDYLAGVTPRTFTYYAAGTLQNAVVEDVNATYVYDYRNLRRQKTLLGRGSMGYLYGLAGELLAEKGPNKVYVEYIYADGMPVAQLRYDTDPMMPITAPPKISGFSPSTGKPNDLISVFGSGFVPGSGTTKVKIGSVDAPIVQVLDTNMLAVFLPTGVTTGPIQIVTKNGTTTSSTNFGVSSPGVSISGIWPSRLDIGKAGTVFIFGGGFASTSPKVYFSGTSGDIPAPLVQPMDSTLLLVFPPAGIATGIYQIKVVTAQGTTTSPGDIVLEKESLSGGGVMSYLHADHQGTPRSATDSTGKLVWYNEGYAFGWLSPTEDPDRDGKATIINLRFPGQYYDWETKLHYNWNRYYDPSLGRYITSDPIGYAGGLHTYNYANNNPVRFTDRTGLLSEFWQDVGKAINPNAVVNAQALVQNLTNNAFTKKELDSVTPQVMKTLGFWDAKAVTPLLSEPRTRPVTKKDPIVLTPRQDEAMVNTFQNLLKPFKNKTPDQLSPNEKLLRTLDSRYTRAKADGLCVIREPVYQQFDNNQ